MNLKILTYLRKFVETQYNHWALYSLILGAVILNQLIFEKPQYMEWWLWILCGLFPLVGKFLLENIEEKWKFVLGNLILCVVLSVICMVCSANGFFFGLALLIYFGSTVYYKLSPGRNLMNGFMPPVIPIILSVIVTYVLHLAGGVGIEQILMGINIGLLFVYLFGLYLSDYLQMISAGQKSAGNMPKREIFITGMKGLLLLLGALVLIVFLCLNIAWLRHLFMDLTEWITEALRTVGSWFSKIQITDIMVQEEGPPMGQPLMEEGEPSRIVEFFSIVAGSVIIATVGLCLGMIVMGFFREFLDFFGTRFEKNTFDELPTEAVSEVREVYRESEKTIRKRALVLERLNPTEKIRKLYRKRLLTEGEIDPAKMTAREYAAYKKNKELASVYEKARYSDTPCDNQDLKLFSNLLKKMQ